MVSLIIPGLQLQASETSTSVMSRGKWAKRISESWQKQVTSIFETGSLLESAKAELRHGDFMKMVKDDLPFAQSVANKLMKIAACDHLRNSDQNPNLPANWTILHELALLTEAQFEDGIKSGAIHPKMKKKDAKTLRGDEQKSSEPRESAMAILKRQLNERVHEVAHLKEQLAYADQGSLFDLKKDSSRNIAEVVVSTVTKTKAKAIAEEIMDALKAMAEVAAIKAKKAGSRS